jgi:hypothetical protein
MPVLQEQKPGIAMDGMYAGFAGAKTGHFSALPLSNITPKYRIFTPYPFHRRSNSAKIA